ncbi:Shedu anti-phage system protein SduA domain-containing protein [Kitasatospora sp. NPDC088346]|uniref:Shedu anti-phage system protein SduA domain-containing protein n=1 Tax=Kitasatospora sp. NPDC088346 TaxID=3364073 RepID=UPI003817D394
MTWVTLQASDDPARPRAVSWDDYRTWLMREWADLLASGCAEAPVQRFLEAHPSLLPGATDDVGPGGHHGATLWSVISQPELQGLGRRRYPDFMWVRRDTASVRPICIEIEDPSKRWFNPGNQTPTAELTEALDQLIEWKVWFSKPENQSIFLKTYASDFTDRTLEPQYVLIYGRDAEFRPGTSLHTDPAYMRAKRNYMRRDNEHFYTFDSLKPIVEAKDYGTVSRSVQGWNLKALPPTFTTHPMMSELFKAVASPELALADVPLIDDDRRAYVAERWEHWRIQVQRDRRDGLTATALGGEGE